MTDAYTSRRKDLQQEEIDRLTLQRDEARAQIAILAIQAETVRGLAIQRDAARTEAEAMRKMRDDAYRSLRGESAIQDAIEAVVDHEREECAAIVDSARCIGGGAETIETVRLAVKAIAAAIRARGDK